MTGKLLIWSALGCVCLTVVGFVGLSLYVSNTVDEACAGICEAHEMAYPEQRVEALLEHLESEETSFEEKNRAIWALGQLAEPRATSTLESLRANAGECAHAKLVCQYELGKAIERTRSKSGRVLARVFH